MLGTEIPLAAPSGRKKAHWGREIRVSLEEGLRARPGTSEVGMEKTGGGKGEIILHIGHPYNCAPLNSGTLPEERIW